MTQQTKTYLIAAVGIAVIVGLVWSSNVQRENDSENIKIGAVYPMTGYGASWGENQRRGAQLAVEEINEQGGVIGRSMEVIVEDNQTEVGPTINAAKKLIQVNGIDFLLTGWTQFTQAQIPIIRQEKIVTIDTSSGGPEVAKADEYLFRTWPSDVIPIEKLVALIKSEGMLRVAVAKQIGPWEDGLRNAFIEIAEREGLDVVEEVEFQLDERDFKTSIVKLIQADPEIVYAAIQTNAFGTFLQQAQTLGLNARMIWPVDLDTEENRQIVGDTDLFEGVIYPVYEGASEEFREVYRNRYSEEPGVAASTAYDAVHIIANAIRLAGTVESDVVRQHIESYEGASGFIEFNEYGDRKSADVVVMTYRDGKFVRYDSTN